MNPLMGDPPPRDRLWPINPPGELPLNARPKRSHVRVFCHDPIKRLVCVLIGVSKSRDWPLPIISDYRCNAQSSQCLPYKPILRPMTALPVSAIEKKRHQPICARVSIVDVHHELMLLQKSACLDRIEPGNSTLLIASKPACSSAFIAALAHAPHTIVDDIFSHFKCFMTVATPKRLLYHRATMPTDLAHNADRSSKTAWMIACGKAFFAGQSTPQSKRKSSQSAANGRPGASIEMASRLILTDW